MKKLLKDGTAALAIIAILAIFTASVTSDKALQKNRRLHEDFKADFGFDFSASAEGRRRQSSAVLQSLMKEKTQLKECRRLNKLTEAEYKATGVQPDPLAFVIIKRGFQKNEDRVAAAAAKNDMILKAAYDAGFTDEAVSMGYIIPQARGIAKLP